MSEVENSLHFVVEMTLLVAELNACGSKIKLGKFLSAILKELKAGFEKEGTAALS